MKDPNLKGKTHPETLELYESLFQDLKPISSLALKNINSAAKQIQDRKQKRTMNPIKIEYVHLKKYQDTLKDPKQKKKFFETEADASEEVLKIHESQSVKQQAKQSQANNFTSGLRSKTFDNG